MKSTSIDFIEEPIEALNVKVHHGFGISFTSPQYKDPFCKNIIHVSSENFVNSTTTMFGYINDKKFSH